MTQIELNDNQQKAVELMRRPQKAVTVIGGYAGTGKTLSIGEAVEGRYDILLLAPTNKAATVLAKATGCATSTIHKATLICQPEMKDGKKILHWISKSAKELRELYTHVIIDEASMVGEKLMRQVTEVTANLPLVLVGDPFQLPPVNDEPFVDLDKADVTLTEVFRQAEGSKVLEFATLLRQHEHPDPNDFFDVIPKSEQRELHRYVVKNSADLIYISRFHDFRGGFVRKAREAAFDGVMSPRAGERVVAYATEDGLVNGYTYTIVSSEFTNVRGAQGHRLAKVYLDGINNDGYILDPEAAASSYPAQVRRPASPLGFAYAITAHKAQGSQWRGVLIDKNQKRYSWKGESVYERERWLYTAVTRAEKDVFLI